MHDNRKLRDNQGGGRGLTAKNRRSSPQSWHPKRGSSRPAQNRTTDRQTWVHHPPKSQPQPPNLGTWPAKIRAPTAKFGGTTAQNQSPNRRIWGHNRPQSEPQPPNLGTQPPKIRAPTATFGDATVKNQNVNRNVRCSSEPTVNGYEVGAMLRP